MKRSLETDFSRQPPGDSSPELEPATGLAGGRKRRILIVDNDSNSTHLVKVLLEKSGAYQVLEENDATKAHQTARRSKPDLILLDIMMPKEDGGEVAAELERDPELRNTPIIFLTALVTKSEAESGLRIQGYPFLAKPINIPELIDAIEQHLPVRMVL